MPQSPQTIIAGAGIAGLATAIALTLNGRKPLVLERAGEPYELGAGLQLSPNAVRVLKQLGLAAELAEVSLRPHALVVRNARTAKHLASVPFGMAAEKHYGAPYYVLARPALHQLLTQACLGKGIEIRYGCEVESYSAGPGGIDISLAEGKTISAEALIGADGLWSKIRKAHWPGHAPKPTGMTAWRATIAGDRAPHAPLPEPVVTAWLAPKLHAVTYPIDATDRLNLVVVIQSRSSAEGWDVTGSAQELRSYATRLASPLAETIAAADNWRRWPLFDARPMPRPADPSTAATLIGDAAHPMMPFLAQGAAMAIEDALSLGQAIAANPSDPATAFRQHERERASRVNHVTASAARNGAIFHLRGALALARDLTLKLHSEAALLRRYDWLYGGGPARIE